MHLVTNEIRRRIGLGLKEEEKEIGIKGLAGHYWGFPDGCDVLGEGLTLYYEIEEGQHHPDTNVLKYWPVLEEDSTVSIILVQWMKKKPSSKNRWLLAHFVADKMEQAYPDRFMYVPLELDESGNEAKLSDLKDRIGSGKKFDFGNR